MSRKLLLNSFSGTTLYVVSVIVAFIMSPIYIKALGNRDYGLWEMVMSVVGYMGLLDLGISGALVRFVSVADGKADRDDLQKTISTAFAFFVVLGVISVFFFSILCYSPGFLASGEAKDIANLSTVFMLFGINAGVSFPMQVFVATLMGTQKHYFINNVRIVQLIVSAGLYYYLLKRYPGNGLIVLALLTPVFTAVQFLLFAGAVFFDQNIPKMTLSAVSLGKAKEMFTFGAKSATMIVASRLQNQTVPLIIGHVLGLGQVVFFVMPNRLVDYAKGISRAIGFPLTPYFGAAIGKGGHDGLLASWLKTTMALQVVSLAMPILVFFCGETFLQLWIGQEYAVAGRMVLYILLVGLIADSLSSNAFSMLTALGKHGRSAFMWFVFSVISIPLGIVGGYLWGLAGVAAGTTVVTVMANLITVKMTCREMQISLPAYFNKTFVPIFPALLILTGTLFFLTATLVEKTYLNLILQLVLSVSIYIAALWIFSISRESKVAILNRTCFFSIKK